jgi:squalene monooxygenase
MPHPAEVDVIVAGGGVAGAVSAAALQQIGYSVMVVEPGLHNERRLAGEVFHPPGVSGLAALGLLDALTPAPAVSVNGFSILSGGKENGCIRLPYDLVRAHSSAGLSLDHGLIRERLQHAARGLPGISFRDGERVVGIDQSDPSCVLVQVANGKAVTRHRCGFLVAADGAISRIAQLAGIKVESRRISTIFGYRIPAAQLPAPDYGHVFLGARAPILIYPISRHEARILFDLPYQDGCRTGPAECLEMCIALPAPLREHAERAIAEQPRLSVVVQARNGERSVAGRVVIVGDAAGCCHPLTASGMTMCISDAVLLRDALATKPHDVREALLHYQSRRARPQITRLTLADALRDAFWASTPEWYVVRRGIFAYWRASSRGRAATLALLSTADGRSLSLVYQMLKVVMYGLVANYRKPVVLPDGRPLPGARLAVGLAKALLHHVSSLLRIRPIMRRPEGDPLGDAQGEQGKTD